MMVKDIFLSGEYIGKGYVSRCQDMMWKDIFLDVSDGKEHISRCQDIMVKDLFLDVKMIWW